MRAFLMMTAVLGIVSAVDAGQATGSGAQAPSGISGTWITTAFGELPNVIDLQADGTRVVGTISRNQQALTIYDGRIDGNTVTFKVLFAGGDRINSYTGTLNGDEMSFTRSVQVRPGGNATGEGIFGASGPMQFVAKRDTAGVAVPRLLYGTWKLNLQQSKYDPGPTPKPTVAEIRNYASRPEGAFGIAAISAGAEGIPNFNLAILKADGNEYPAHNAPSLAEFLGKTTPSVLTISMRMEDERTFEVALKTGGVVTATRRITVSRDGNTLTETAKTIGAKGQTTATNMLVFERVMPAVPASSN
jgi:hypothetical protein